jgi:hypothetical protein
VHMLFRWSPHACTVACASGRYALHRSFRGAIPCFMELFVPKLMRGQLSVIGAAGYSAGHCHA